MIFFYIVVSESLGRECSESVKESFIQLKEFTKSTKSVPYLMKMFNLCNLNIKDYKTVQNFLSNIIDLFAGIVQYNEDNRVCIFLNMFLNNNLRRYTIKLQLTNISSEKQFQSKNNFIKFSKNNVLIFLKHDENST